MKTRKIASLAIAATLCVAMYAPAAAADVTTAGNAGTAQVALTAEATNFRVTVPTSIPISVDLNGVVTMPSATAVAILNNSYGQIKVTSVTVTGAAPAGGTPWTVTDYSGGDKTEVSKLPVDSNKVAFAITPYKAADTTTAGAIAGAQISTADASGAMAITTATDWVLDGVSGAQPVLQLKADAMTTAVSTAQTSAHIADVVFTIGWNK